MFMFLNFRVCVRRVLLSQLFCRRWSHGRRAKLSALAVFKENLPFHTGQLIRHQNMRCKRFAIRCVRKSLSTTFRCWRLVRATSIRHCRWMRWLAMDVPMAVSTAFQICFADVTYNSMNLKIYNEHSSWQSPMWPQPAAAALKKCPSTLSTPFCATRRMSLWRQLRQKPPTGSDSYAHRCISGSWSDVHANWPFRTANRIYRRCRFPFNAHKIPNFFCLLLYLLLSPTAIASILRMCDIVNVIVHFKPKLHKYLYLHSIFFQFRTNCRRFTCICRCVRLSHHT